MNTLKRTATAAAAVGTVFALAAPALAAGVDVTVVGLGGTRQFSVEDVLGNPLTAIDLGTGGSQPFRTHVQDASFLPNLTGNYSVTATMNNLYLKTGSTYDYATKIPSSAVKVGFGGNPLSATGLSLSALPHLSVSGVLSNCTTVALDSTLRSALGLSVLGAVLDPSNTALTTLCTALGGAGATVDGVVDGVVQTLTPTIASVLDLPTALGGAVGGTFTNPSYGAGTVGAGDTAGAASAPAATAVSLMTGTQGLSSNLVTMLTSLVDSTIAGLPLVGGTGVTAKSTVDKVVAGLTASGSTAVEGALASVLANLSAANKVTVINDLLDTVTTVAPVIGDLKGVTGNYYGLPVLTATPSAPVAGNYGGTMTVTFVQS